MFPPIFLGNMEELNSKFSLFLLFPLHFLPLFLFGFPIGCLLLLFLSVFRFLFYLPVLSLHLLARLVIFNKMGLISFIPVENVGCWKH